jgi:hypothetical protein
MENNFERNSLLLLLDLSRELASKDDAAIKRFCAAQIGSSRNKSTRQKVELK